MFMKTSSIEKDLFKSKVSFEPNAAMIGISCDDWYCHKAGMSRDEICSTMQEKKYDIVPMVNDNGKVTSYFTLNENKVAEINSTEITESDTIYYLTHIKDVIWLMNLNQRSHYFLANYENKEIIGLISLSNLNCREFSLYLFSMLALVEKELSNLITTDEALAIEYLENKFMDEGGRKQLESIKNRLSDDRAKEIENDYKEYLYIHHLVQLVNMEKRFKELGYNNEQDFIKNTKPLKDIRNAVAHPVKSLVRNFDDLANLQKGLNKLYEFRYGIEKYLSQRE